MCNRPDNARALFLAYRAGWSAAAGGHENPSSALEPVARAECDRGYADGWNARRASLDAASGRLGYMTRVLRPAESDDARP